MKKIEEFYEEFIYKSRYSRWDYDKQRREIWDETVDRYFNFLEPRVPKNLLSAYKKAKEKVLNLEVMPSMRALWSAGPALEKENIAAYNCAYVQVDNSRAFAEALYVSMNGTGIGFSVERQFIAKMPILPDKLNYDIKTIIFEDSKIGWADGLDQFINYLYSGKIPNYDLSNIRPEGAILKTFGGRASGPQPLENLLIFTINLFKTAVKRGDKRLNSLECHDLMCKIAEIVVVGGVRRCQISNNFIYLADRSWKVLKDVTTKDKILFEGQELAINNVFDNGIQNTNIITMEDDTTQICTPEHKWYVYNHKTDNCEWVQTKDLDENYSMLEPKNI